MTAAADLVLANAEVHTLETPDRTHEAVAVRDGEIVRVGSAYDVEFLADAETRVVDLEGRVVLPGFIDAHTHMETTGKYLVHADLSAADSLDEALDLLAERADETESDPDHEWVLGYGYDESTWPEDRYLERDDLDAVTEDRPVVAFREDMHVASVNSVVLDRVGDDLPGGDVHVEGGEPTGVVVEDAVGVVSGQVEPDAEETGELVLAAQRLANERGVTGVHDMVRHSWAPEVYRDLERAGDLTLRIRINYWSDHLDALVETGLGTNHGSDMVRVGAIKSFTDGSFGGRTAKLSEPYHDAPEETGAWVVEPEELRDLVDRADDAGFQLTIHAIGDAAIDETLDALGEHADPGMRHRIEHAELAHADAINRFSDQGVVASVQPNFLKWAGEGGLYESRIGARRLETNRYAMFNAAGVPLAFGSDGMPLDPLLGVHHCVNAPVEAQRLEVTEALRAYTLGSAYAGFDEGRLGTVEVGKKGDLVALEQSPWEQSDAIDEVEVALTVVDGEVVYEDLEGR